MAQVVMIPGGPTKGTPITESADKDVRYWFDRIAKDLRENPDKEYADRDRAWLAAAKTELVKRGVASDDLAIPARSTATKPRAVAAPNGDAARPPSTALTRSAAPTSIVGSARDPGVVNAELEAAVRTSHLVSPATICGFLPEGCEVAISMIKVDPNTDKGGPGEVSPVGGGKLSLSGFVLKRIGAAAGISWDMNATGRLDDGSDPHYCHYRAVGWVRNFDGSVRCLSGEVEIDMREGSPQFIAMKERAKDGSNFTSQLRDTRLFLIRHAETKAKLRAIADMGVKRSYTTAELAKPFKVARLMWTGRTDDPELKQLFAAKTADAMIGASSMMYGVQTAPAVRPAPTPMTQIAVSPSPQMPHGPPPLNQLGPGAFDDDAEIVEHQQEPDVSKATAGGTSPTPPSQPEQTDAGFIT